MSDIRRCSRSIARSQGCKPLRREKRKDTGTTRNSKKGGRNGKYRKKEEMNENEGEKSCERRQRKAEKRETVKRVGNEGYKKGTNRKKLKVTGKIECKKELEKGERQNGEKKRTERETRR